MATVLAIAAALSWGVADFLAALAARVIGPLRTLFYMEFFGLIALGAYLAVTGEFVRLLHTAPWQAWLWAIVVGLLNIASTLALYRSYEIGTLAIVSPIVASSSALTVALSFASGERLSSLQDAGIVAALSGIVLAAMHFAPHDQKQSVETIAPISRKRMSLTRGLGWAIIATLGYGLLFWLLGFYVTPALGGVVPVWLGRLITISVIACCAAPLRQSLRLPPRRLWWMIASIGIIDATAYVTSAFGLRIGPVAIVSVLASLFSTVTVLLAWIILRERLQWHQWLGICIIFLGVVLVNI